MSAEFKESQPTLEKQNKIRTKVNSQRMSSQEGDMTPHKKTG